MKIENNNLKLMEKLTSNLNVEEKNAVKTSKLQENDLLKGESAAVIAGAKIIKENGYKVDKETISNLKEYLNGDKSEIDSKLSALKTAIEKDMPLKENLLSKIQVNTELSLVDFLDGLKIASRIDRKDDEDNINSHSPKNKYSVLEKNETLLKSIFKIIDNAMEGSKANYSDVESDSNNSSNSLKEKSVIDTSELSSDFNSFDEIDDKSELIKAITDEINNNLVDNDFDDSLMNIASYLNASQNINESFSVSQVLEVKVTQKLINLKNDFTALKSELTINIYKISDESNNLSKEDKLNILYKSIEKLDTTIMKSEMSLYMDLKGERELIKISSNLQIAKKHIENGKIKEAETLFKSAKMTLDKLKFEPSIKKAFAIVNNNNILKDNYTGKEIDKWIKNSMESFTGSEKSVSSLINYLRKMGINNDVEQFQDMQAFKDGIKTSEFKNLTNLKQILLKMNENSGESSKDSAKTNQILEHIEGNQLKNKIIESKQTQSVELEIPINLSGRIKNVKVFIKSPQKMLKLDWENFDMYFVLNSDKMGEMGIKVSAVQRKLSVKIINDKALKLASENNLDDNFKKELQDFGYRLVKMVMESWNNDEVSSTNIDKKSQTDDNVKSENTKMIDIRI